MDLLLREWEYNVSLWVNPFYLLYLIFPLITSLITLLYYSNSYRLLLRRYDTVRNYNNNK